MAFQKDCPKCLKLEAERLENENLNASEHSSHEVISVNHKEHSGALEITFDPGCTQCLGQDWSKIGINLKNNYRVSVTSHEQHGNKTVNSELSFSLTNPDFDSNCEQCNDLEKMLASKVQTAKNNNTYNPDDFGMVQHSAHDGSKIAADSSENLRKTADIIDRIKGLHFDDGKPSLALLSRISLEDTARVLDFGAKKYSAWNWRMGISWTSIMNSALRHLYAFNDGEDLDEESGLSHLAHSMCDIMFLLEYYHLDMSDFDDRWSTQQNV